MGALGEALSPAGHHELLEHILVMLGGLQVVEAFFRAFEPRLEAVDIVNISDQLYYLTQPNAA